MALTDTAIRNAKPGVTPAGKTTDKPYRLFDAGGLYLEVTPAGAKWWRFKYRFAGKEKRLSLGVYPDTMLASRKDKETGEVIKGAREKRDDARQLLADGIDPGVHRKVAKSMKADSAANTFEAVAREWYKMQSPTWADSHGEKIIRRLELYVFPYIGKRPIADVTPAEVLATVRRVEELGILETAHRAMASCGQVFRYAVATNRAARDPTGDLRGALQPVGGDHFAAITDPKKVPDLLRALDAYEGSPAVKCALRLAPLVFVRPGELRMAQWADVDLDEAEWRYDISKTARSGVSQHIVPLCTQAVPL